MLCLWVPSLNSKLEPLRKDRIRKAGQPCVQPSLYLKFRQSNTLCISEYILIKG